MLHRQRILSDRVPVPPRPMPKRGLSILELNGLEVEDEVLARAQEAVASRSSSHRFPQWLKSHFEGGWRQGTTLKRSPQPAQAPPMKPLKPRGAFIVAWGALRVLAPEVALHVANEERNLNPALQGHLSSEEIPSSKTIYIYIVI